jgi:methylmalonyl-CoA/ethylmalonyl-CoA epimerase
MIKRIAHISIATESLGITSEFYKSLGLELDKTEILSSQKVKVASMRIGGSAIEFIEPTESDSPISNFLARRGHGLHHISFEVDDLEAHLMDLQARGVRLIDQKPRIGAGGYQIAFVHPHSTGGVLVELSQAPKEGENK